MILLKNVTKTFDKSAILKGINIKVKKGEVILLIGPSGSGKSTLLSIIGGILKPTSGDIEVDGIKLAKIPDNHAALFRRNHIGFIFQRFNLINDLSVFDNVALPLIPTKLAKKELNTKVIKALNLFHIEHKKDELVRFLSGGEQQRVAISRAIVNNPSVILADEPTANIDYALKQSFLERLKELKELKKTIIIATHDEVLISSELFDRKLYIKDGMLI